MRLVTYARGGLPRLGAVVGDRVIDLNEASGGDVPAGMLELLGQGEAGLERARRAAESGAAKGVPLSDVTLLAPIAKPPKNVIAIGLNYREHAAESARAKGQPVEYPKVPVIFSKPHTAIIGHEADIVVDYDVTKKPDYEVELAVVIGKRGKNIPAEQAMEYVAGYTASNDVSARDLQSAHIQFFKGKGLDTFCPLGPWIVTTDEIPDPGNLAVQTRVNGVVKQDSNTNELIFDVPSLVQWLSAGITLEPGDIIMTGTPSGVGFARTPPEYLQPGDVVEVEIEKIGVLRNRVTSAR